MKQTNFPTMIVVHCSATPYSQSTNQLKEINDYHRDVRGFNKSSLGYFVGYHSLITGGKNTQCRVDEEYGNHCNEHIVNGEVDVVYPANSPMGKSINYQSLGVCIGFNGDVELPTQQDTAMLRSQIKEWQAKWNISNNRVFFHHFFTNKKTCPGTLITQDFLQGLLMDKTEIKKTLFDLQTAIDKLYALVLKLNPFK